MSEEEDEEVAKTSLLSSEVFQKREVALFVYDEPFKIYVLLSADIWSFRVLFS